ncbi:MAG: hypothetical protein ACXWUR_04045 [Allosphingosinicella sp.]
MVKLSSNTAMVGSTTIRRRAISAISDRIGSAARSTLRPYRPGPWKRISPLDWFTTSSGIACIMTKLMWVISS